MVKIFSNFDTSLMRREIKRSQSEYGAEHVLAIRRDFIYLFYRVLFPVMMWLLGSLIILWVVYGVVVWDSLFAGLVRILGLWLIIVWWWYCVGVAWVKMIDYYMDFTIITPTQVMSFDQTGILQKTTRTLDTDKIKSIRVDKKGLLGSIFNYGSIVFLSEGDAESLWEIRLNYMSDPNRLREKIENIIEPHVHGKSVIKYYTNPKVTAP
jgi:uncharacterized membrane protein YdbT with pleckstrin-like domain